MDTKKRPKIVIVGAGFAGIQLVQNIDDNAYDIVLLDKVNHHMFQPLFYQVATSQIEPSSISFPIRKIISGRKNTQFRLANVYAVNQEAKQLETSIGIITYDKLIISIGCKTNFFGNKVTEENSLTLKTTFEAISIRNHILKVYERILSAPKEELEGLNNLVIVGAGPTGVELAGAFAEIRNNILPKDYPRIDFSKFKVYLIEGSGAPLSHMSENAQNKARDFVVGIGAEFIPNTFVKNYDGEQAELSNGEVIKTKTLIWAAGVIGNTIDGIHESQIAKGNRLIVDRFNKVINSEDIYAVGDIAFMATEKYPNGHPQVANVAINQAKNLVKNLNKMAKGKTNLTEYEYVNLGTMATIGRNKAVVDLPFIKFAGRIAWLVWMFLHLMLILSVKKKLIIFIHWAYNYFTKDSSLRLILGAPETMPQSYTEKLEDRKV